MKRTKHQIVTLLVLLGIGSIPAFAEPFAKGPYLGQTSPGSTAQVFAPGLISHTDTSESDGTFSADGKIFVFQRGTSFYLMENTDEGWTTPRQVTGLTGALRWPYISPDGNTLYFYSDDHLSKADRTPQGWTGQQRLGAPVTSSVWEGGFSLAADNSFYICSWRSRRPRRM